MRGKRQHSLRLPQRSGITPAHAGKTGTSSNSESPPRDHPRACGENAAATRTERVGRGSPPRMRGKLPLRSSVRQRIGITPAHAGKHDAEGRARQVPGITPAHAGKTFTFKAFFRISRDHPRACGENFSLPHDFQPWSGSPPRMRGKQDPQLPLRLISGITPAHAGKTLLCSSRADTLRDHPRACGENASRPLPERTVSGSPPRMRGKRVCAGIRCRASGITPAHAGKTPSAPSHPPPGGDHPRACGENRLRGFLEDKKTGSPPRMRGKRISISKMIAQGGITPAHAGKTIQEE